MSRIYDALQRADQERRAAQQAEVTEIAEPFAVPAAGEPLPARSDTNFEDIALRPWVPAMSSLPTLADNGESIEQFHGLRSQIYQYRDQAPFKTILISSGMPAEGKTFIAANLAMSLARNKNNRVLLIDADLRRPVLHTILGAPLEPGLIEYLAGGAEVSDIIQRNQNTRIVENGRVRHIPNLAFIPAGSGGDNLLELIANHRFEDLIRALSPHFDWILVDSPPVLAFADAIDLARAADAVLLVARAASTPFDVAQRAQAAFSSSRILGFVLNAVKDAPRNGSYYYYGRQEDGRPSKGRKDKRR
jgi:capsular exopolysaccharide synthesis family protein